VERLEPAGRLLRVRRLTGGIDASTHRVDFETRTGAVGSVVVRSATRDDAVDQVRREWANLGYVAALPFTTPEPLLLDGDGSLLGAPSLVMSLVPGRSSIPKRGLEPWVDQMAETMAAMHDAPLSRDGAPKNWWVSVWKLDEPHEVFSGNRLAEQIWPLMVELRPVYESTPKAFCHLDYWPGNVLFSRGRLTGVIDWSWPGFQHFAYDVAMTAFDLEMELGAESGIPARFVRTYEAATGRRVEHLEAWGLPVATRAVTEIEQWAAVYRSLGRPECTAEVVTIRLHDFIAEARRKLGR
jgi:Ser/Thr protein kinase RdoA (MazF antagonist)